MYLARTYSVTNLEKQGKLTSNPVGRLKLGNDPVVQCTVKTPGTLNIENKMKGKGQTTKSSVKATSVAAGSSEGSWHRPPAYLRQGPDTSLRELPVSFVSFFSR